MRAIKRYCSKNKFHTFIYCVRLCFIHLSLTSISLQNTPCFRFLFFQCSPGKAGLVPRPHILSIFSSWINPPCLLLRPVKLWEPSKIWPKHKNFPLEVTKIEQTVTFNPCFSSKKKKKKSPKHQRNAVMSAVSRPGKILSRKFQFVNWFFSTSWISALEVDMNP